MMDTKELGRAPSGQALPPSAPEPFGLSPSGNDPSRGLRVLVCGGRTFENAKLVNRTMEIVSNGSTVGCVIEGGARGADYLGKIWAEKRGIPVIEMRANWMRYGKRAGPVRNQWMLDHGRPDVVVAFPGGPGTLDMTMRAEGQGFHVIRALAIEARSGETQGGSTVGESAGRKATPE